LRFGYGTVLIVVVLGPGVPGGGLWKVCIGACRLDPVVEVIGAGAITPVWVVALGPAVPGGGLCVVCIVVCRFDPVAESGVAGEGAVVVLGPAVPGGGLCVVCMGVFSESTDWVATAGWAGRGASAGAQAARARTPPATTELVSIIFVRTGNLLGIRKGP
jgi:hypothetical protein